MRILQTSRQFHPCTGGVERLVMDLCQHLHRRCVQSDALTRNRSFYMLVRLPAGDAVKGVRVTHIPYWGGQRFFIAPDVLRFVHDYDLLHVHNVDFFADTLPHHLERLHIRLERESAGAMAHGWAVVADQHGRRAQWTKPKLRECAPHKPHFSWSTLPPCTLLIRRSCFENGRVFDPQVHPIEDWGIRKRLSSRCDLDWVPGVTAGIPFEEVRQTARYSTHELKR